MIQRFFHSFIHNQYTSSFLLLAATIAAIIIANSPWEADYHAILHTKIVLSDDHAKFNMSIGHWINDGLMAIFFLVVGLEIKRELMHGELATREKAALPLLCALGGVIAPAILFMIVNREAQANWVGWAVPTATDIAFALGLLTLGGKSVPVALKVFLTALAIIDDLIAILIIALFYGAPIQIDPFLVAIGLIFVLFTFNLMRIRALGPYLIVGVCLWVAVLQSGLHATLAGVALAATIPLMPHKGSSPLHRLEHALHPVSAFVIMPVFALANAGLSFAGMNMGDLLAPLPLGIAVGLFFGKQLGIYLSGKIAVRMRWATLPEGANWKQFYAVSCLAGVGFTMSLFIGSLAFPDPAHGNAVRLGVIVGSVLSALVGVLLLRGAKQKASV